MSTYITDDDTGKRFPRFLFPFFCEVGEMRNRTGVTMRGWWEDSLWSIYVLIITDNEKTSSRGR